MSVPRSVSGKCHVCQKIYSITTASDVAGALEPNLCLKHQPKIMRQLFGLEEVRADAIPEGSDFTLTEKG
jgi:hypothetical protein